MTDQYFQKIKNSFKIFCDFIILKYKQFQLLKKESAFVIIVFTFIGILSNISIIRELFPSKTDRNINQLVKDSQKSANLQANSFKSLESSVENIDGLDCTNLEDNIWINDGSISSDNQYLFLKENQQLGSLRLSRQFSDLFTIKFTFIPMAMRGINTTISIKDDQRNELSLTIGDSNYEEYRITTKKEGEIISDIPYDLGPTISRDQEVYFQLETFERADSVFANAFIYYHIKKKPNIPPFKADLYLGKIPYFFENKARLNIGLRKSTEENDPKIRLVSCSLKEK